MLIAKRFSTILAMALTPVPSINLDNLPKEAISLIETLAHRAQEADRLEQENRLLREMLRLERLRKYGPKSEKLSEEQVELLELEPGVHAQEVEKESGVSSGGETRRSASTPGATPCPSICRGARKSLPWKARRGSACAAERSAAASAMSKRKCSTWSQPATSCE